jgi:6-pyruvoyltetrahydropterin/6-carboxytetrahydropterin synthase
MFAIEVTSTFSAAHALRLPNGQTEPLHGHDFRVTVKIACDLLDPLGTVMDFHDLEDGIDIILTPWRNQNLNDFEPFKTRINPSAERIAEHIGKTLLPAIANYDEENRNLRLVEVRLTEAPNCLAIWSPACHL